MARCRAGMRVMLFLFLLSALVIATSAVDGKSCNVPRKDDPRMEYGTLTAWMEQAWNDREKEHVAIEGTRLAALVKDVFDNCKNNCSIGGYLKHFQYTGSDGYVLGGLVVYVVCVVYAVLVICRVVVRPHKWHTKTTYVESEIEEDDGATDLQADLQAQIDEADKKGAEGRRPAAGGDKKSGSKGSKGAGSDGPEGAVEGKTTAPSKSGSTEQPKTKRRKKKGKGVMLVKDVAAQEAAAAAASSAETADQGGSIVRRRVRKHIWVTIMKWRRNEAIKRAKTLLSLILLAYMALSFALFASSFSTLYYMELKMPERIADVGANVNKEADRLVCKGYQYKQLADKMHEMPEIQSNNVTKTIQQDVFEEIEKKLRAIETQNSYLDPAYRTTRPKMEDKFELYSDANSILSNLIQDHYDNITMKATFEKLRKLVKKEEPNSLPVCLKRMKERLDNNFAAGEGKSAIGKIRLELGNPDTQYVKVRSPLSTTKSSLLEEVKQIGTDVEKRFKDISRTISHLARGEMEIWMAAVSPILICVLCVINFILSFCVKNPRCFYTLAIISFASVLLPYSIMLLYSPRNLQNACYYLSNNNDLVASEFVKHISNDISSSEIVAKCDEKGSYWEVFKNISMKHLENDMEQVKKEVEMIKDIVQLDENINTKIGIIVNELETIAEDFANETCYTEIMKITDDCDGYKLCGLYSNAGNNTRHYFTLMMGMFRGNPVKKMIANLKAVKQIEFVNNDHIDSFKKQIDATKDKLEKKLGEMFADKCRVVTFYRQIIHAICDPFTAPVQVINRLHFVFITCFILIGTLCLLHGTVLTREKRQKDKKHQESLQSAIETIEIFDQENVREFLKQMWPKCSAPVYGIGISTVHGLYRKLTPAYLDEFIRDGSTFNAWQQEQFRKSGAKKNRFATLKCVDQTRVKLENRPAYEDYIHANYVTFADGSSTICTQPPVRDEERDSVFDFWYMVFQEKIEVITMLCKMTEVVRPNLTDPPPWQEYEKEMCFQYFPLNEGETMKIINPNNNTEHFRVTMKTIAMNGPFTEHRVLHIENHQGKSIETDHIWFTGWREKTTPEDPTQFAKLLKYLLYNQAGKRDLVHCSTGTGRTMTLVGAKYIILQMKQTPDINFDDVQREIRQQRHCALDYMFGFSFMILVVLELMKQEAMMSDKDEENLAYLRKDYIDSIQTPIYEPIYQ